MDEEHAESASQRNNGNDASTDGDTTVVVEGNLDELFSVCDDIRGDSTPSAAEAELLKELRHLLFSISELDEALEGNTDALSGIQDGIARLKTDSQVLDEMHARVNRLT